MAGLPNGIMLTGANAKIIVNGLTLAFATDISYSIKVRHANPKVLGMYETQEFTPLAYDVTGTFTVIRYVRDAINNAGGVGPVGTNPIGNGIGNWTKSDGILDALGVPFGAGSDEGNTHRSFVPRSLNIGHHFDIEIRQLVPVLAASMPGIPGLPAATAIPSAADFGTDPIGSWAAVGAFGTAIGLKAAASSFQKNLDALSGGAPPTGTGQVGIAKLRNCRITQADFVLSKRSVARQTFQFMARYADEDSFLADKSGVGQDLE